MGILFVWFTIMSIVALAGVILLFVTKDEAWNTVWMLLMTMYSFVISFLSATSMPSNYVGARILAWSISLLAIAGVVLRFVFKKQLFISKLLISCAVVIGVLLLYFG